jgi:hypothetical protein
MRQCARYGDRFYTRIVDATDETTWMQPDQEPVC